MNESLLKETTLMNEAKFGLKVMDLLVIIRTYWVMCYSLKSSLTQKKDLVK